MNNSYISRIKGLSTKDKKEIVFFDESKPKNIIKNIVGTEEIPDIVFLSELVYNEIFKNASDVVDLPIESLRVIFALLHYSKVLHYNQRNTLYTPSLFEEEFLTKDNSFVSVSIPNKLVSPSRETKRIKEALDLLSSKTSRWVSSKNKMGELVQSRISFIEKPSYTRGKINFEISSYWIEKLANIEHYNKIIFNLVYNIPNTKQVIFSLWLNTLPLYKEKEFNKGTYRSWTKISINTIQERFGLKGKDYNYISEKFFKPLQNKLFKFNDKSFAFQYQKGLYYITALEVNSNTVISKLNNKDSYNIAVKYAVSYLQQRHRLDKATLEHIRIIYKRSPKDKELMEGAYKLLKAKMRKAKIRLCDLKGSTFLDLWQTEIIISYEKTEISKTLPNAYPKVNTSY